MAWAKERMTADQKRKGVGEGRACKTLELTVKTGFYGAKNRNSKIRRLGNSLVVWWASQLTPVVQYLPANAGDTRDVGSIPGSGRSPGIGNGNPLQYSCLENSMDGGAWWAIAHEVTKSRTWLSINLPSWWLARHIFTTEGVGSIPGSGTKISQALQQKKKKKLEGLPKIMLPKKWQS